MAEKAPETTEPVAPDVPAPANAEPEWETLRTGLGKEWDFEKNGPLVGTWVGIETMPIEKDPDRTEANAYIFADPNGEQVFLWESHELSTALTQAGVGDKLRISFLGRDSFTGDDGPRQIKRYKVERAIRG